ncbi:hypothetical protein [Falsiroseomonas bella]|uniref:hypothetical protein n=1 Tax=Falsiroseomonas bella TaxID=2184016 RepID=UPI0018EEA711|nr:hypothetical protein [Falsiroseomonas bella]
MDLPEEPGERWMALMRQGAWEQAWQLSDAALAARGRHRDWTLPRHLQTVWDGTPLAGRRVLVRCYHGLGDTIQFIRLVPRLQAIAREVIVWAQPALIPLLATLRPSPRLLPLHDGTPEARFDTDIEIMELAHALRITPAGLDTTVPYLHPPRFRRTTGEALEVGLVWRAGDWDTRRSVPLSLLQPLGRRPGVALRILQRGPALAERDSGFGTDIGSDDALTAASRIAALDLVISIDSMPAHLAGALGVPVWLLLPEPADWRWMEGRDDSPWYPGMRLFRQDRPGDWTAPVTHMLQALRLLMRRRQSRARSPVTSTRR